MDQTLYGWLAIVALAITWFAATGARSMRDFSRSELEEICRRNKLLDRLGQILLWHERVALAAESLQVVFTALSVWLGFGWLQLSLDGVTGWRLVATELAILVVVLLAVEIWISYSISRLWAEPFLFYTWPAWVWLARLLAPLVAMANFFDTIIHRLAGKVRHVPTEETFDEEIRTVVTEGHREGLLGESAREMIEGVIDLDEVSVSQIMTPRTDMVCLPVDFTFDDALKFVTSTVHTRIPVFDKTRDNIVGLLHVRDLLAVLANKEEEDPPLVDIVRQPYFVPETKAVNVLLHEFRKTRTHMAVVLDEYGGVSGLVTIEDALEEIVGEIVDEYDEALVDGIKQIDEQTAEVLARIHIDEINTRLGVELPEDGDFDTIGGFVFSELGHVPHPGEEIIFQTVRIRVLDVTRRRIEKVRIEILDQVEPETV